MNDKLIATLSWQLYNMIMMQPKVLQMEVELCGRERCSKRMRK